MPTSDELLLKLIYQEENQKALADASAQLEKMTQAEKDLIRQNAEAAESTGKFGAAVLVLNQGIELGGKVVEGLKKIWEFSREGASIKRINEQWAATASDFGVNGDKIVAAVNKVTGNTLDNESIMQAASRTLTQGLVQNGDQIVKMFEVAQAMSVRFGGSAVEAFQAESIAIETGMSRQLRAQGITVDFEAAYKKYADAVHKTTTELTDQEKQTIRLNEVMEKGAALVRKVGDSTGDSLSKMQRFEKGVTELGDTLKEDAVDVLTPFLDDLNFLAVSLDANASRSDKLSAALIVATENFGKESDEVKAIIDELNQLKLIQDAIAAGAGVAAGVVARGMEGRGTGYDKGPIVKKAFGMDLLKPEEQTTAASEYQSFQGKLSDIENKGYQDRVKIVSDAADQINQLEANSRDKRISILTAYDEDEQKIDDEQNKQRIEMARTYGTEVLRMEQDHQREMLRMQEDHGIRMGKLADSRDALGLEDEIDNYEVKRRRAEEDYQVSAGRRNEDYAQQLKDQSENFEAQRRAREVEKDKQLRELQTSEENQRRTIQNAEDQKLRDLEIAMANDRNAAATQWQQWREEHGLFLEGEKATYDAFLQYQIDALRVAMGQSPTGAPTGAESGIEHGSGRGLAGGGYAAPFGRYTVGENGPETLVMGARGGFVVPNRGGNQFSVSISIGGTNASLSEIKAVVYQGIAEVMQAAQA